MNRSRSGQSEVSLNVLLIEDDPDLSVLIMEYLEMESIYCDNAPNGITGLKLAKENQDIAYDCIILDINLPLMDGLTLCKELRKHKINTPVLMLTARDRLEDKLEGFALGANDYVCKPFEMRELIARIKVLAKKNVYEDILRCDDLVMDLSREMVKRGEREIILTRIEWKILKLLLLNSPDAVTKQKIIFEVWGDNPPDSDSLKVHMHNLRKAIDIPGLTSLLHTVPGKGYRLAQQ